MSEDNAIWAIGALGAQARLVTQCGKEQARAIRQSGEVIARLNRLPSEAVMITGDGADVVPVPRTLAQARAQRWAAAKAWCDARMAAGCAAPLGRVQSDADSIAEITLAAQDAAQHLVGLPAWSITWTMADNTQVAHSAAQFVALLAAVRAYRTACHAASQAIRARINAAATVAAVDAVDVGAGYPA